MENKSEGRTWPMKAVKEKLQIFSMLKRTTEMGDVPQKITLRDKLTLSSQILAQNLFLPLFVSFCCSGWPSSGLASTSRTSDKASLRQEILTTQYMLLLVVEGNFAELWNEVVNFTPNFVGKLSEVHPCPIPYLPVYNTHPYIMRTLVFQTFFRKKKTPKQKNRYSIKDKQCVYSIATV